MSAARLMSRVCAGCASWPWMRVAQLVGGSARAPLKKRSKSMLQLLEVLLEADRARLAALSGVAWSSSRVWRGWSGGRAGVARNLLESVARLSGTPGSLDAGFPSVDRLLREPAFERLVRLYGRPLGEGPSRCVLQALRGRDRHGEPRRAARRRALEACPGASRPAPPAELGAPLRRVLNATGVLLHTNLGRAPLPPRGRRGPAAPPRRLLRPRARPRDRAARRPQPPRRAPACGRRPAPRRRWWSTTTPPRWCWRCAALRSGPGGGGLARRAGRDRRLVPHPRDPRRRRRRAGRGGDHQPHPARGLRAGDRRRRPRSCSRSSPATTASAASSSGVGRGAGRPRAPARRAGPGRRGERPAAAASGAAARASTASLRGAGRRGLRPRLRQRRQAARRAAGRPPGRRARRRSAPAPAIRSTARCAPTAPRSPRSSGAAPPPRGRAAAARRACGPIPTRTDARVRAAAAAVGAEIAWCRGVPRRRLGARGADPGRGGGPAAGRCAARRAARSATRRWSAICATAG